MRAVLRPAHHLLLLTAVSLHLLLIGAALLLVGAAALFLYAACLFLLCLPSCLLLKADDLPAVGNALFGGAPELFLHVAALALMLGVLPARVTALAAVGLFPLHIGAGSSGAVASPVTGLLRQIRQSALLVQPLCIIVFL